MTTSGIVSRRSSVRSIAITGVMPLPPTRNSIFAGGGSGSTKSPVGRAPAGRSCPARGPLTRCAERKPSGIARTVIAMVRPPRFGGELTRSRSATGTCRRPGPRCRRTGPGGGRSASPSPGGSRAWRRPRSPGSTFSMRPRSSRGLHSGLSRRQVVVGVQRRGQPGSDLRHARSHGTLSATMRRPSS